VYWAKQFECKFIDYFRQFRSFADKMYVISYNSRAYLAQFLLRKFLEVRWTVELIMHDTKILSMIVGNPYYLYSLNFLPMSLKRMHKSFYLNARRGIILTFSSRPTIWTMWAIIANQSSMGQTTCQAMSEPTFWNVMRSKEQNFLQ